MCSQFGCLGSSKDRAFTNAAERGARREGVVQGRFAASVRGSGVKGLSGQRLWAGQRKDLNKKAIHDFYKRKSDQPIEAYMRSKGLVGDTSKHYIKHYVEMLGELGISRILPLRKTSVDSPFSRRAGVSPE